MDVLEAIKTRRSIRNFLDIPVDKKDIEIILDAGRWAPSWSNTQCWHFIVVQDLQKRNFLANTLHKIELPDRIVENPAAKSIRSAPLLIVVCARMKVAGGKPGGSAGEFEYVTDKGDWFMFDTALAVENMALAAHAIGLGTVIIGAFDAPEVEKYLNIPHDCRVVVMLPVGVPMKKSSAPPRKDLSEIVSYESW